LHLNTTGSDNTAVGQDAFYSNTTGNDNTCIGKDALSNNTTGSNNTGLGFQALKDNTTASNNTAVGYESLEVATTATSNTALGSKAGVAITSGSNNVVIGKDAGLAMTTAYRNTIVGYEAATSLTNSQENVCVGSDSADEMTTGRYNTFVGNNSGHNMETGQHNVFLGHATSAYDADAEKQIVIGTDLTSLGDWYITLGRNGDVVSNQFNSNATWTRNSDERMKKDILTNTSLGLDFINELRTVTYKWKAPSELPKTFLGYNEAVTEPSHANKMYGFVAQEVKAALDKCNITDFNGWTENKNGEQGISYEMFVMPLVKAVQELSAKVTALEAG